MRRLCSRLCVEGHFQSQLPPPPRGRRLVSRGRADAGVQRLAGAEPELPLEHYRGAERDKRPALLV